MRYTLCQSVRIVDMNDEIIHEVLFEHGEFDYPQPSIGLTVVSYELGLRNFEVVYDHREGRVRQSKIIDVEINLLTDPKVIRAFLEPVKLIVGQHDVGVQ